MKKIYLLAVIFFATLTAGAQCTIDPGFLPQPGIYPAPQHLPHIVRDSLYDQTVQGYIPTGYDTTIIIVSVSLDVDSVRLDSIAGLPTGITWVKNPNVLPGGGRGCIEFMGTTSDTVGTYKLTAYGAIWATLKVPVLSIDTSTETLGDLNRIPPFRDYSLVVDSAPAPLSAHITANNSCFLSSNGSATVFAAGGTSTSPYTYLWSNGATVYTIAGLDSGTFYVTVTSDIDTVVDSVTIYTATSALAITTHATGSNGNDGTASVNITGGTPPYSIYWNGQPNGDSLSNLAPGNYRVLVVDSFGCTATRTVVVQNFAAVTTLADLGLQVNLFPNPANGVVNLQFESEKNLALNVEVLDLAGRTLYSAPLNVSGHYNHNINVASFSTGMYIMQISAGNQSMRQKFIIAR